MSVSNTGLLKPVSTCGSPRIDLPGVGQVQPVYADGSYIGRQRCIKESYPSDAADLLGLRMPRGKKVGANLTLWSREPFSLVLDGVVRPALTHETGTYVVYLGLNDRVNFPDLARRALEIFPSAERQEILLSTQPDQGVHRPQIGLAELTPAERLVASVSNKKRQNHPQSYAVQLRAPGAGSDLLNIASAKNKNVTVRLENYDPSVTGTVLVIQSPEPFLLSGKAIGYGTQVMDPTGKKYTARIDLADPKAFPNREDLRVILTPTAANQQFTFQTLGKPEF